MYDYSHGTTVAEHWRAITIVDQTKTSWILAEMHGESYAIAKTTGKFRGHDHRPFGEVKFTRAEVDANIAYCAAYDAKKKAAKK